MTFRLVLALGVSTVLGATLISRPAEACGGCFAPPTDNTVVTDHRMVLSISKEETTLYDQIRYSGNPASFAWVLPIRGIAEVGISEDIVFQTIAQNTKTEILPPPQNCPSPPNCYVPRRNCPNSRYSDMAASASPSMDASAGAPVPSAVEVLKEETVGPYETVQLAATDPDALGKWLTDHGYAIPEEIEPMLGNYVSEGFGFLALKLVPGAGIQSMKPVRVTTEGAAPSLPLRMVAAGSGASVGLTLWVVAEARWEPQTFPSFAVEAKDLEWTWASSSSDYSIARLARVAELGGAAWEIESSIDFSSSIVTGPIQNFMSMPTTPIYEPYEASDGGLMQSSNQLFWEDMKALFQSRSSSRVTRMRSDLPRASLATDLVLQAASTQNTLERFRQLTREADEPQCGVYDGCKYTGTEPRSAARQKAGASCGKDESSAFCAPANLPAPVDDCDDPLGDGGCSVITSASTEGSGSTGLVAIAAMAALAVFRKRRSSR